MSELIAGLDEIATETQFSEGWTYIAFPKLKLPKFIEVVNRICIDTPNRVFHGKKFKKAQANDYRQLLQTIRQAVQDSPPSLLAFTLMNQSWKSKYLPFIQRLVGDSIRQAGISNSEIKEVLKRLAPGLFGLQRMLCNLPESKSVEIEVGRDKITKSFSQMSTFYEPKAFDVKAETILKGVYNRYRKQQFPQSPELSRSGIRVVRDAKSRVVQAADVFGNFAMAYLFVKLGNESTTRKVKAEIFDEVFGELLTDDLTKSAKLNKKEEVELLSNGSLTLVISQKL